ncbi:MAG: HEAT repeat domain-containing protein, partial [Planctomycetota bacterium]
MTRADKIRWTAGLLFGALALFVVVPSASAQDDDAAMQAFEEGLAAYREGNSAEALAKFQEVIAADPSNETAYRMWTSAGYDVWVSMLAKDGDYRLVAERLMGLSAQGMKERQDDSGAIEDLVEQLRTGDYGARRSAILAMSNNHGEYAAAALVPVLADQDDLEFRVRAIDALQRLGRHSVLPLIAALGSSDAFLRRNAAIVLGNIGDERAKADLKGLYEGDAEVQVQEAAATSLQKITGADPESLASAQSLFLEKARAYAFGLPPFVRDYDLGTTHWTWSDDGSGLARTEVPANLRPFKLAEDAAYRGMMMNPENQAALSMLALVLFAEANEVRAMLDSGADEAEMWEAELGRLGSMARATGREALSDALNMALAENRGPLAAQIIGGIEGVETSESYEGTSPLGRALLASDKQIRVAAAIALANIAPSDLADADRVVSTLNSALGQAAIRQVLLVASDEVLRNRTANGLEGGGYYVSTANSGALGLDQAMSFPHYDLILISTQVSDVHFSALINQLQNGSRTQGTPIVLIAPAASVDQQRGLYSNRVTDVISDATIQDGSFLEGIASAAQSSENETDRRRAETIAASAARALAHTDSEVFNLSLATDGLLGTLSGENDE